MAALLEDVLLIVAGTVVPAAIYAIPKAWGKLKKIDDTVDRLCGVVETISHDTKCLYQVQRPQLAALEISLLAIKGEQMNGNVESAIDSVRFAHNRISEHLEAKITCSDIGEGVD